jgi:hypothetical protein
MWNPAKPPCPVCGAPDPAPIYPKNLGMPAVINQFLIGYRCSNGHTFLPAEDDVEKSA